MHDAKHSTILADSGQEYSFHIKTAYQHLEEATRSYNEYLIEMKAFHRHLSEAGDHAKKINLSV